MPPIDVVFFKEEDESVPVLDWLDTLAVRARAKCAVKIERLKEMGMAKKKNSRTRKKTSDAVAILHRRYFAGRPANLALLEEERANAAVARQIHDLREKAGFTQRELAKIVGTTASVICRLENADYEGHSLAMLRRIARALDSQVEIHFVPIAHDLQHT